MAARGQLPLPVVLLPIGLLLPVFKAAGAIREGIANRQRMTAAIEATLAIHTLGSLWLAAFALYLAIFGA